MSAADQAYFLGTDQTGFHGWLIMQINSIGNKGKRQMFYVTFIAKYFGLSREGIDIMAGYGYGVTLDMYDKLRKTYKLRAADRSRSAQHIEKTS